MTATIHSVMSSTKRELTLLWGSDLLGLEDLARQNSNDICVVMGLVSLNKDG